MQRHWAEAGGLTDRLSAEVVVLRGDGIRPAGPHWIVSATAHRWGHLEYGLMANFVPRDVPDLDRIINAHLGELGGRPAMTRSLRSITPDAKKKGSRRRPATACASQIGSGPGCHHRGDVDGETLMA